MDVAEFRLAVLLLCRAKEVQAVTDSLVESLQKKKENNNPCLKKPCFTFKKKKNNNSLVQILKSKK